MKGPERGQPIYAELAASKVPPSRVSNEVFRVLLELGIADKYALYFDHTHRTLCGPYERTAR